MTVLPVAQQELLAQIRDIAADPLAADAQAGARIRAVLFPAHSHDDDGTVEGCPGCFAPGEAALEMAITRDELHAALAQVEQHSPAETAHARTPAGFAELLFTLAAEMRHEAGKWMAGSLYVRGRADCPQVYLREPRGWYSYSSSSHFTDGAIDTTGLVRLVPAGEVRS